MSGTPKTAVPAERLAVIPAEHGDAVRRESRDP